jgi:hypothetical protein
MKVMDGEGWESSFSRVHDIGAAFRAYQQENGRLPPAVVRDQAGRPLYSWRVLLLPYLAQEDVYKQFKLDESWDGPENRTLAEKTPRCYRPWSGADPQGLTRYRVPVGPGTAFERDGLTRDDFPDGLAETLLVAEAGEAVPWSKPEELAYDPGGTLPALGGAFAKPSHFLCYEVAREPGFNAAFADGSARFIRGNAGEAALRALFTRNGGEKVDWSKLE